MAKTEELERLLTQVAAGDRDAFGDLYALTSGKLFGVCLRILASRPKAQAALWSAFVEIWQDAKSVPTSGLRQMTWMIHVAHQKSMQRLRLDLADVSPEMLADEAQTKGEWPEDLVLKPSEYGQLIKCMEVLPWERSAVFRLAFVEGETYPDLAAHFDLPVDTMRPWGRQDLQILSECLER